MREVKLYCPLPMGALIAMHDATSLGWRFRLQSWERDHADESRLTFGWDKPKLPLCIYRKMTWVEAAGAWWLTLWSKKVGG